MANVYDDLLDLVPEEEQEENQLVVGAEFKYPRPIWLSGVQINYAPPTPKNLLRTPPIGFHYEVEKMPSDFIDAAKKLAEKKNEDGEPFAVFVTVQHKDGTEKEYIKLNNAKYYVLAHGTPARTTITTKRENQLGIAVGNSTFYNHKEKKTTKASFVSCLAVEENLYRAGYVDDDGNPKIVNLYIKGITGTEFYNELVKHARVIKRALDLGMNPKFTHYWAYAQYLEPSDETVAHGKGTEVTKVYTIVSRHPKNEKEVTQAYIESLFCGAELYRALAGMVKTKEPVGEAIVWCQETCEAAVKNEREFTGPHGQQIKFGNNVPAPDWLLTAESRKDAALYNQDALPKGGGLPDDEEEQESPLVALATRLDGFKQLFERRNHSEGVKLAQKLLAASRNDMELPEDQVVAEVTKGIEELKSMQKAMKSTASNPY